ncbi:hypothetical protein RKE38_08460 [Phycicoccus sp. M110.8]|uniref:hypothetical protein n=1 Tax=Phycicoccus sp. M110.8 TaxID=3075433 RepID=UPI0028FD9BA8|nr:hypothetical protein [Phycicoccus sp. M110.8]MDU0313718.1 hypothetical protein [Phycicoccus sp. M110.8]
MSTLDDLTTGAGPGGMAGVVSRLAQRLRPVSRRGVLLGATVAATALATKPKEYALRPVAAYATICGPGNTASSGWTVFCATVNKGVNTCPPGSFAAGWWKAADSSWCGGGYRYIVDCNASCSKCSTGCTDGICDSKCWSCSCGTGSTATCDQRRVCCNAFRYGQCNTQVKCSGGVHCRVVSCVAPYKWAACTTTSLSDNRTAEHSSPLLPQWGGIAAKYKALGEQGSFLRASTGPEKAIGDGKGRFVAYQGGWIVWSSATGARAMNNWTHSSWVAEGAFRGILGYPTSDLTFGLKDSGWIQLFQNGAVTDSLSTTKQTVTSTRWRVWRDSGRERGELGYPTSGLVYGPDQYYWIQTFQGGAITDSRETTTQVVTGVMWAAWRAAGRETGVLAYPSGPRVTTSRGASQTFTKGELWALGSGAARRVYGAVLTQWKAAGGATGSYGYPVTDTVATGDGRLTCTFEGGTITA